jgi:hypothetical protein
MKIIYKNAEGLCGVLTPAPKYLETISGSEDEKLVHVANRDLPEGTPYEIVNDVPSDRTFRNAWEYVSGDNERIAGEKKDAPIN